MLYGGLQFTEELLVTTATLAVQHVREILSCDHAIASCEGCPCGCRVDSYWSNMIFYAAALSFPLVSIILQSLSKIKLKRARKSTHDDLNEAIYDLDQAIYDFGDESE